MSDTSSTVIYHGMSLTVLKDSVFFVATLSPSLMLELILTHTWKTLTSPHHLPRRVAWFLRTPQLFIEIPVSSQENERSLY